MITVDRDPGAGSCENVSGDYRFEIGGVRIAVHSDAGFIFQRNLLRDRFISDFLQPDIEITIRNGLPLRDFSGIPLFESGNLWRIYRYGEGYTFHFRSPAYKNATYKLAEFSNTFNQGIIYMNQQLLEQEQVPDPLEYPLDELLLLAYLSTGDGVEIHACAVVDPQSNKNYLFAGQSGAGKSTIARLCEEAGCKILSDDRIVLRKVEDTIRMYGTPWHGESRHASAISANANAIYILKHGPRNCVRSLSAAQGAAELFSRTFPTYYRPEGIEFTLSFLHQVAVMAGPQELQFVPDQSVIQYLRNLG
jgi:hypothetical protein